MNNYLKKQIMEEIERKSERFEKKSDIQYRIRCPLCGDSTKNPTSMHCYIKCDYSDPNENIKFNCFLCNRGGSVGSKFLSALGADKSIIDAIIHNRNNSIGSIKEASVDIITGTPVMNSPQINYIEKRLGPGLTIDDYQKFKIIWDMNKVIKYISDERTRNTMPNNLHGISFLSDNKSMLISRSFIDDSSESQWRKIKLFNVNGPSFYTIQTTIDLFTSEIITINIAEGIMDILSAYKNFNTGPNSVYIASLGSNYISALNYMIAKGFVGKNIDVNIYIDWDVDEKMLIHMLKKYRWEFRKIKVYKNIKFKDIGVRIEDIKLMEVK